MVRRAEYALGKAIRTRTGARPDSPRGEIATRYDRRSGEPGYTLNSAERRDIHALVETGHPIAPGRARRRGAACTSWPRRSRYSAAGTSRGATSLPD